MKILVGRNDLFEMNKKICDILLSIEDGKIKKKICQPEYTLEIR